MVANVRTATALALPVPAELGRRIQAGGQTHEIDDERMSREHATVRFDRGAWVITDRASRNGTYVEGNRIGGEVKLPGNVVLRLGHTVFVLLANAEGHPAPNGEHVIGPELARSFDQIRGHAASRALLVHGEPGTGKELAARVYHESGPRSRGPFVAVNCAAIPEGVAERLFCGANKSGAFAGAIDAFGHFQSAAGGTLFLDEVADLDPPVQAKLLRVLETREVVPLGTTVGSKIDIGIVAAGHRELRAAVADGRFLDELYQRLARATVYLPALRERKVDIARLVQREVSAVDPALAPHAKLIETCMLRAWPGNVRELRAAVRQATGEAKAGNSDDVRAEHLAPTAGQAIGETETALERPKPASREVDKEAVIAALARASGVVSVAARALGLHRTQLYRLMEQHGLDRDDS